MMATVQTHRPSAGQASQRTLADGKAPTEALRFLKQRRSDATYRCLVPINAAIGPLPRIA